MQILQAFRSRCLGLALVPFSLALVACGADPEPSPSTEVTSPDLTGSWRAVLTSPGGELPFTLRIEDDGGSFHAVALHGAEEAPFSGVTQEGSQAVLAVTWYDSEVTVEVSEDGASMVGQWRRTSPGGTDTVMPFAATRGSEERFQTATEAELADADPATVPSVDGAWSVMFTDEDGTEPARGEFRQQGERVTGTFLTPTGDYRFLEGSYGDGLLRLSTFDGAHAFLFTARAQEDGSLVGDFWSRDSYHATWTARPAEPGEEILPDAWSLVGLTNDEGRFAFEFPDLEGQPLASTDPRFEGKVVLVNVFGSWCPNCNDEGPHLADWYRRYRDQGLEIVGLAYEFSGDPERDREMVRRFGERHGIEYPLLLGGTNDKTAAAETLPDIDAVIAYPTSIFIGRDGTVRRIHSGFSGPGTGEHYDHLVAELEALIEELLAET